MDKFIVPVYLKPIDASYMRRVNRSVILELIRQNSPIARSEINRALGLSMPTVMRIVDELIEEDLVRPTGETAGSSGRPRELLEYNKDGYAVIGVDLGEVCMYVALANIGGEILGEVRVDERSNDAEKNYQMAAEMVRQLLALPASKTCRLMGISAGAPGITHAGSGVVEWAPSLAWRDFELKNRLEDQFHLPVVVENDVNLAALGEQWFGAGRGVQNMVLLSIGTGLGGGVIIDGGIYRGYKEGAGEAGYMLPGVSAFGQRYDRFGPVENIISGTGITERARVLLSGKIPENDLQGLNAETIFNAARDGKPWAFGLVKETVEHLALVIANTAALLDPELIVLGGGVSNSADLLLDPIRRLLEGVIPHIPRIEASTLGARATVLGGITLMVHTTRDTYMVKKIY